MKYGLCAFLLVAGFISSAPVFGQAEDCIDLPPGPPHDMVRPDKATILHCGCSDSGSGMEYVQIRISSRARGHLNHVAGSIDSCALDGTDTAVDFVRNGGDCQIDGAPLGDDIALCSSEQFEGAECGAEVMGY